MMLYFHERIKGEVKAPALVEKFEAYFVDCSAVVCHCKVYLLIVYLMLITSI